MTAAIQTIVALLVVALAAAWLVRRALALRHQSNCGDGCGAISSDARALRKRLKKGPGKADAVSGESDVMPGPPNH